MLKSMVRCILGLGICLASAGCDSNVYTVELNATADGLDRHLSAYNESDRSRNRLTDAELEKIAAAYPAGGVDTKPTVAHFHGVFKGRLPNDVGGAGSFEQWKTTLGTAAIYLERIRGDDDVLRNVEQQKAAADWWCDQIAHILAAELPNDPAAVKLQQFVRGPMRRDVANLTLICWARQFAREDEAVQLGGVIAAQCGQYLIERDYITLDQLPEFRESLEHEGWPAESIVRLLRPVLARKVPLAEGESWQALEQLLADRERLQEAFLQAVQTTNEFKTRFQQAAKEAMAAGRSEQSAQMFAGKVGLEQALKLLAVGNPLHRDDQFNVVLKMDAAPLQTNGVWNAAKHSVSWKMTSPARDASSSYSSGILYAVWATPNPDAQLKHLGRITLTGQELIDYCWWHAGLTDAQRQAWDKMLETIGPQRDDQSRLERFRFAGAANTPQDAKTAARGTSMLLNAMRRER
jgi:hypothetical protein